MYKLAQGWFLLISILLKVCIIKLSCFCIKEGTFNPPLEGSWYKVSLLILSLPFHKKLKINVFI